MERPYTHLNTMERQLIEREIRKGTSLRDIAVLLARSPSTICRELQRNRSDGHYRYLQADRLASKRLHQPRRVCLLNQPAHWKALKTELKRYWSPDQIVGRTAKPYSRSTIYRKLEAHTEFEIFLRGPGKRRRRNRKNHDRIHERKMIDERPAVVETRTRIGDFEADTIWGPTGSKACVVTYVDRKSGYLFARLCSHRRGEVVNRATSQMLKGHKVKTVTVDNGMEFASFKKLELLLKAPVYFAHEHSPWERGSNENTNGLLRQFFPKKTCFKEVTARELARAVRLLNNRPRKRLGYRTPKEVYQQGCCT